MNLKTYELYCWMQDASNVSEVAQELKEIIVQLGGEIISERHPEKRDLAYPIRKQKTAFLFELVFSFPPGNISHLKKELSNKDKLLRNLILQKKEKRAVQAQSSRAAKPRTSVSKKEKAVSEKQLDKKLEEILQS